MAEIFVFGANLAGRHGKGSALEAVKFHGAVIGGFGFHGNSYGIPTKDARLNTLPLNEIKQHVDTFIIFAKCFSNIHTFKMVKIGCGLAGYKEEQIKPMFKNAPLNVDLPEDWRN
jgi:hypothetical protein